MGSGSVNDTVLYDIDNIFRNGTGSMDSCLFGCIDTDNDCPSLP